MKNNNSSNKIAKILSLRKTPWDKKINKTPLESFIRNHNKKTYEERHTKSIKTYEEIKFTKYYA